MGFLDNVFTEEEFDDYRYLEKNILNITSLNEADDDTEDDPDESNFDMPDEPADGDNPAPTDNQQTPQDNTNTDMPAEAQPDVADIPEESNFDMPDDAPDTANEQPQLTDNTEQPADDGTEATPQDQGGDDETMGDDPDESNFDLPDEPGEGDEGAGGDMPDAGGDGTGADGGTSGTTDTGDDGSDPDQNIRDAEGEIFANLSDKDKINKVNELKTLYEDLYNRIVTLHDKVNEIPKDDDLIKVYNFVTDNLADMKEYVYDYMTTTFDNKTYLENMINYKKYLSTLNVINGILEEIRKGLYKADK